MRRLALVALAALLSACAAETPPETEDVRALYAREQLFEGKTALIDAQYQAVLEHADLAIAQEPEWADPYILKGRALARLGQPVEAAEALDTASRLAPDDPNPRMLLGMLSELDADRTAAAAFYREALERYDSEPGEADAAVALAVTTYLSKGRAAGLSVIREVVERFPDYRRAVAIESQIAEAQRDLFLNEMRPDPTLDQGE